MVLRKIYQQLGIEPIFNEEVEKLNSRVILIVDNLYSKIKKVYGYDQFYPKLINGFAFLIGEHNVYEVVCGEKYYLPLKKFFKGPKDKDALQKNVTHLTYLLKVSEEILILRGHEKVYSDFLTDVKKTIESPPIEIGYRFNVKTIIKKGAKELDEKLISENLTWLTNFPNIQQLFENSLKYYLSNENHYPDVITNAYSALEGLVKTFLNTDKRLDTKDTRADLIKQLELEDNWAQLLFNYCKLAHEFSSRHGKKENGNQLKLKTELVEFYIYITGTVIRLISQIMKRKNGI